MALWVLLEWLTLPTLSSPVAVLLALLLGTAIAIYAYATRHFDYWRRKGVPYLRPIPIAGNLKDFLLFRKHIGTLLRDIYIDMKNRPYIGVFFFDQPVLFVKDASLWKSMMHKDFDHFADRGFYPSESDIIFGNNLLSVRGEKWRVLRDRLSPAFTSGKVKKFYALLEQKAAELDHYFDDPRRRPCNVTRTSARYAMDAISTVGFGVENRALLDDNDPLYRVLYTVFKYSKLYAIAAIATFSSMPLLRLFHLSLVPEPLAQYLRRTIWGVVRERESAGLQGVRGDFLDLLMELRAKGRIASDDQPLADAHVAAAAASERIDMEGDNLISQVFGVLSAGFDATTATMSYVLYHLAKYENVQERLRKELKREIDMSGGKLTYEVLQSAHYLDMILSETLRLFPPLPFIDRVCTKDYRIPGTNVVINKGVLAFTSVLGIHRDPELYSEPERFDPERFSDAHKRKIPSGAFLPFGLGAHQCVGLTLGLLQIKVAIAHIVLNYRVHPCADTPEKIEFNVHSFLSHPRNELFLNFSRVS